MAAGLGKANGSLGLPCGLSRCNGKNCRCIFAAPSSICARRARLRIRVQFPIPDSQESDQPKPGSCIRGAQMMLGKG